MDVALEDLALRPRTASASSRRTRSRRPSGPACSTCSTSSRTARRDARLPQELPDDDLRLLRDAHGRARRPRLQGADEADRRARPRAGDLGDGQPADRQGPRRRHGPVLAEGARRQALARARLRRADRAGVGRLAAADERDQQGVALHHVRLLRLGVQRDGGRPRLPRPGGAREGDAVRRRPARPGDRRAAERATTTSTGSGTARGATSATSAARRASTRATRSPSSAPSRSSTGIDHDMGAKHAKWFVTLGEDDGLAARDRARAEDAGQSSARSRRRSSRSSSLRHGKVPPPCPTARRRPSVDEARALYDLVKEQGRDGALGIVQGERALARIEHVEAATSARHAEASERPAAVMRSPTTRAASPRCRRRSSTPRRRRSRRSSGSSSTSWIGHVLRRGRHPRGRAGLLPAPERADPRLRRGDRLRTR